MLFPFHDDNPTEIRPWVTCGIIAVNAVVFLFMFTRPPAEQPRLFAEYGFVPQRIGQLFNPALQVEVNVTPADQMAAVQAGKAPAVMLALPPDRAAILGTLFTSMFMHGGVMHLVGNMWFFWIFGNNVEDRLGHGTFLFFYLTVGLIAAACHWGLNPAGPGSNVPVIGASGAVAGVLGAYAVTYPTARVKTLLFVVIIAVIELPALLVLGAWFIAQLLSAHAEMGQLELSGGVAWWAHVGGFLAGAALMPLLSFGGTKSGRRRDDAPLWFDAPRSPH